MEARKGSYHRRCRQNLRFLIRLIRLSLRYQSLRCLTRRYQNRLSHFHRYLYCCHRLCYHLTVGECLHRSPVID